MNEIIVHMNDEKIKLNKNQERYIDYYKSDVNIHLEIYRPEITSDGLAAYTFKYKITPRDKEDISKLKKLNVEIEFIVSENKDRPYDHLINPVDNVYIRAIPEVYEVVSEKASHTAGLSAIGAVANLGSLVSVSNPVTAILPLFNIIISSCKKKVVKEATYVQFHGNFLKVGIHMDHSLQKKPGIEGEHEVTVILQCNSNIKFLMPRSITFSNLLFLGPIVFQVEKIAEKIITKFDAPHSSHIPVNINPDIRLPSNSIVFVCDAGTYISKNNMANNFPLPEDYGFITGNVLEKIIIKSRDTQLSERLYPKYLDYKVTLITIPYNTVTKRYDNPESLIYEVKKDSLPESG